MKIAVTLILTLSLVLSSEALTCYNVIGTTPPTGATSSNSVTCTDTSVTTCKIIYKKSGSTFTSWSGACDTTPANAANAGCTQASDGTWTCICKPEGQNAPCIPDSASASSSSSEDSDKITCFYGTNLSAAPKEKTDSNTWKCSSKTCYSVQSKVGDVTSWTGGCDPIANNEGKCEKQSVAGVEASHCTCVPKDNETPCNGAQAIPSGTIAMLVSICLAFWFRQ